MTPDRKNIDGILDRYLPSPSKQEIEDDGARVLGQLRQMAVDDRCAIDAVVAPTQRWWKLNPARVAAVFAAAALISVFVIQAVISPPNVYAVVETVDGSLYRVSDGKAGEIRAGERIGLSTPVRTDGNRAVLKLQDGALIEMQGKSELSLEAAADGLSIRLSDGSVLVTPAKQPVSALYVQNRDITVPVVGVVFQSTAPQPTSPPQVTTTEPKLSFEVASVRPTNAAAGGTRGTGGGGSPRPLEEPCGNPRGTSAQSSQFIQLDGRRFAANDMTLHALVLFAFGLDCTIWRGNDTLLGGPGWAKTAGFDIQAVIPEGTPVYTKLQFLDHQAPHIQRMLQDLLAERFKLVMRRDSREVHVLVLTVPANGSKLTRWKPGEPSTPEEYLLRAGLPTSEQEAGRRARELGQLDRQWFWGFKTSWEKLIEQLQRATDRPVIDRTGLSGGEYNFAFQYSRSLPPAAFLLLPAAGVPIPPVTAPSLFAALDQELGLKLEATKVPMDVLVIDRAERPSED